VFRRTPVQAPVPAEVRGVSSRDSHGFSSKTAESGVAALSLQNFLLLGGL